LSATTAELDSESFAASATEPASSAAQALVQLAALPWSLALFVIR
jgi:hypothetical protein